MLMKLLRVRISQWNLYFTLLVFEMSNKNFCQIMFVNLFSNMTREKLRVSSNQVAFRSEHSPIILP